MYIKINHKTEKINQYKKLVMIFESKPEDINFSNPKICFFSDKVIITNDYINIDNVGLITLKNNDHSFVGSIHFDRKDLIEEFFD